jgi:hypothetical protein
MFEEDPELYLPQFGGFCSWGISAEFCPKYPWSEDCLGPPGNYGHWTIVDQKLFFFFLDEVKQEFLTNTSFYIEQGNVRWAGWFPESPYYYMNTNCFQPKNTTTTDDDDTSGDSAETVSDAAEDGVKILQEKIEKDINHGEDE